MGALKRMHPLPRAPPAAVYARPNRIDTASSVSFRLMDRAARSPFHCGVGHVGVRARANASRCVRRLEVAVRRSAGALAATRQRSYGCAYSDLRLESTGTTFSIITFITVLHQPRRVSKCLCVWGVVCLFRSLNTIGYDAGDCFAWDSLNEKYSECDDTSDLDTI